MGYDAIWYASKEVACVSVSEGGRRRRRRRRRRKKVEKEKRRRGGRMGKFLGDWQNREKKEEDYESFWARQGEARTRDCE